MDIRRETRQRLGMVVPVYFPKDFDSVESERLLSHTLADVELFVDPDHLILVLDGVEWVNETARRVAAEVESRSGVAPRILELSENRGKGGAVAAGFHELLAEDGLTHFCVRDDDGDHAIWDLPDLFLLSLEMAEAEGTDLALANGSRVEILGPLGMARGFFEMMLNQITYDSIKFALAKEGKALNTRWHSAYGLIPDIESGYKVFSRAGARLFVDAIDRAQREFPDLDISHFGVEIVPVTELLMAGGVMGEVMRTTQPRQPVSAFAAGARLPELYGGEAYWVLTRLNIPADAADTMMTNALARCAYGRSAEGRQALADFRTFVLDRIGMPPERRAEARVPSRF